MASAREEDSSDMGARSRQRCDRMDVTVDWLKFNENDRGVPLVHGWRAYLAVEEQNGNNDMATFGGRFGSLSYGVRFTIRPG